MCEWPLPACDRPSVVAWADVVTAKKARPESDEVDDTKPTRHIIQFHWCLTSLDHGLREEMRRNKKK